MRASAGLRFPRWKRAVGFNGFTGCALHSIWLATTSVGSSQMRHLEWGQQERCDCSCAPAEHLPGMQLVGRGMMEGSKS